MIWLAIAAVLVVVVMVGLVVPREVRIYRRTSGRRGGLLELDTPEARMALADLDDWFADAELDEGIQVIETEPLLEPLLRRPPRYARGRDLT